MIFFICVLIVSAVALFVGYNFLVSLFRAKQCCVTNEYQKLVDQVSRLEKEKRQLSEELAKLEKEYTFLKHDIRPTTNLAAKLSVGEKESSRDERMGNYMLTQSMITLEQHDKAKKMLPQLHMDFASACLALGYIDNPTTVEVQKQVKK